MYDSYKPQYEPEFTQVVGFSYFHDKLKKNMMKKDCLNPNDKFEFKKHNYYLISQEWIREWKRYIGYEEINKTMKEYYKKEFLTLDDYQWVQPIINKNKYGKTLEPLINRNIYDIIYTKNNDSFFKLNPTKNFIILDQPTFSSFINKNDKEEKDISKHPCVQAKFSNNKIIIKIDEENYCISFKYSNGYMELSFCLDQTTCNYFNYILIMINNCELEKWVNINGGFNCPSFKFTNNAFTLEIKNKTLLNANINYKIQNTIRPSLYPNQNNKIKDFQNTLKSDPNLSTKVLQIYDFYNTTSKAKTKYKNTNINQFGNNPFPHLIGLQNIGQTCYMNATLECLSNIQELTIFILNYNFIGFNPQTKPLSLFYWDLLKNLFFPNEEVKRVKYYAPHFFKQIIGKMNPLFQGFHPADSKDLLFFILETLHDELNVPNNNFNMNNFNYNNVNMSDKNQVFNLFINTFLPNNNSIISNLFYGFNETSLQCLNCGTQKYSFQSFNIQIIPLIKAHQYKLQKYNNNYNIRLNLNDALESLAQNEKLIGENMIYCNDCKQLSEAFHQQKIFRTPKILIIVLNRGKGNLDYQGELDFESELDLTNLVTDPNWPKKYFLIGVISHIGESGSSGHFIAFCRNEPTSFFYCYNDASVFQLKKNDDAYGKNQSNDIYSKKTPYILFYKVKG